MMPISYHPKQGTIVTVKFEPGFVAPEMVKRRLAIILSPPIQTRNGLCTVVPLSTSAPLKEMPYHCKYDIPFEMPIEWGNIQRWVKGDMICTVGWHRIDLLKLKKAAQGKRSYQLTPIPEDDLKRVQSCVLHGIGLSPLTKYL
jgi:mRNA interferase MazF